MCNIQIYTEEWKYSTEEQYHLLQKSLAISKCILKNENTTQKNSILYFRYHELFFGQFILQQNWETLASNIPSKIFTEVQSSKFNRASQNSPTKLVS